MISHADLSGIMAIMPAFTSDNGTSVDETSTIDLDRLAAGLNRMIEDGAGLIATCGSFGEFIRPQFLGKLRKLLGRQRRSLKGHQGEKNTSQQPKPCVVHFNPFLQFRYLCCIPTPSSWRA